MTFRLVAFGLALGAAVSSAADPPKAGATRDVAMANGITMRFCWIPAGKAVLGSRPGEKTNLDIDRDPYEFTAKGFWLGKYEVTQAEWQGVMGENPSFFSPGGEGAAQVKGLKTDRFPVDTVSFKDGGAFIAKCGVKGLRLPHEDEWEYACRGGKGNKQAFYFGDRANSVQFNCDGEVPWNTKEKSRYLGRTTPVGSYEKIAPHPWSLCDMHGNVQEWCANLFTLTDMKRCQRGGSWNHMPRIARSAALSGDDPDYKSSTKGLRFCLD